MDVSFREDAMGEESRDFVVIGAGVGGYVGAIRAAQLGRKVTLIERDTLGGVCLNWGCIPSKALLKSAEVFHEVKHAAVFGIETATPRIDYPRVIERSREVAGALGRGVAFLMRKNKIEVVKGNAVLEPDCCITVSHAAGVTRYRFKDVVIAAGGRPRLLPGVEADGEVLHTSRTILESRRLPQKILIVGAGAIGVEFAHFFNTLGAQVTLVEVLGQILPSEDKEVAAALQKIFFDRGMIVKTQTRVEQLKRAGKTVTAMLVTETGSEKWSGDCCLLAVGVVPNSDQIGAEQAGLELDRGFIRVNDRMATNVPHYYAIGDVCGPPLLAHKASHEGLVAAEAACGQHGARMHYDNIPSCTYSRPQVASIGMTEQQLQQAGTAYSASRVPFSAIGKAQAIGDTDGFIKMLVEKETGEVLGVHILHAEATELIAEAAVVRSHEGIAASLLDTIHPHPTLSEALAEAAAAVLRRPINV